jgi:hypothetical protein
LHSRLCWFKLHWPKSARREIAERMTENDRGTIHMLTLQALFSGGRKSLPLLSIIAMVACLGTTATAETSLKIEVANRFASNGECSFRITTEPSGQFANVELRKNLTLDTPGFSDVQISGPDGQGRVQVKGRISRPGFYPFQVKLNWEGKEYSAKDYCVVEANATQGAFNHVGYYVFLGRGDFWDPTHQLALWTLQNWKTFADWMAVHKADTLFVLLNGYTLAYPSDKYGSLRDKFSNNARYSFLREFIDYAHTRGIRVYLTLTTDDHAEGFGELYPETARINRFGYAGNRRALVLEDPKVRQYIVDMVQETSRLYSNADGFVFHPSEEDPDRFNAATLAAFRQETGRDLTRADKAERYRWYNQKFAELMRSFYETAGTQNPSFEFIMFNTWWQDDYVSVYREMLPAKFRVCVWYYDEQEEKTFRKWPIWAWADSFGADRILYMPTGEAFLYPADREQQMERHIRTDRLISAAESLGVKSCVFFAGWDLGSDDDRRRDLAITEFPTSWFAGDRNRKQELLPELYLDYFGARKKVWK